MSNNSNRCKNCGDQIDEDRLYCQNCENIIEGREKIEAKKRRMRRKDVGQARREIGDML